MQNRLDRSTSCARSSEISDSRGGALSYGIHRLFRLRPAAHARAPACKSDRRYGAADPVRRRLRLVGGYRSRRQNNGSLVRRRIRASRASDHEATRRSSARSTRGNFSIGSRFSTETSDRQYVDAFNSDQGVLCSRGECYQVNLARHYATSLRGDRLDASWAAYRRLGRSATRPVRRLRLYAIRRRGESVARALRADNTAANIATSPIKGTAPRHRDARRDAASRRTAAAQRKRIAPKT